MFVFLTFLFATTTFILGYTTYNLYNKVQFYQQWYDNFAATVEEIYNQLKILDESGAMEADDEVGVFFSALRDMMKELFKLGFYGEEEVEENFSSQQNIQNP